MRQRGVYYLFGASAKFCVKLFYSVGHMPAMVVKVFLAHSSEDKPTVRKLCKRLKSAGLDPWLDQHDLRGGQMWKQQIAEVISECDYFVACLSEHSAKEGYVQEEIKLALKYAESRGRGGAFLIPVKLTPCKVPDLAVENRGPRLADFHWLDYWKKGSFEKLLSIIVTDGNYTLFHKWLTEHDYRLELIRCAARLGLPSRLFRMNLCVRGWGQYSAVDVRLISPNCWAGFIGEGRDERSALLDLIEKIDGRSLRYLNDYQQEYLNVPSRLIAGSVKRCKEFLIPRQQRIIP